MAYDKAKWHYGGDFPKDLSPDQGAIHIGMFLAWAIMRGLEGELHRVEWADELTAVRSRQMTGPSYLVRMCDGSLAADDLSAEGNAFTSAYYRSEDLAASYLDDYRRTLTLGLPSEYHVADNWENFDKLAAVLDRRYSEWKQKRT